MTKADVVFLDEVEDFLVSFGLPIFLMFHALTDHEDSDEATPVSKEVDSLKSTKTSKRILDLVAKHELEKAKDRKRHSLYRERRKVEKETLEQQVGELSTELAELQKVKEADRSLVSLYWEMMAKQQLQDRVGSEEKQRRLLRVTESQAMLIQNFRSIIHDMDGKLDDVASKHKRIRLEHPDEEFYKAYALELDCKYAQTDDILKMYGLDSTDVGWDQPRRQWKEDDDTSTSINSLGLSTTSSFAGIRGGWLRCITANKTERSMRELETLTIPLRLSSA